MMRTQQIIKWTITGGLTFLCVMSSLAKTNETLRGHRYCEVIYWHGLTGYVYNTLHLNDCPQALWSNITPTTIKQAANAHFVYLNGPRYYAVDIIKHSEPTPALTKTFGGLTMCQAASMHVTLRDVVLGATPYREHRVERKWVWVYLAGNPVYEIIDPKGRVFVMQSYSSAFKNKIEKNTTIEQKQMHLPKGWTFHMGALSKDIELAPANNQAVVLHDHFNNLYQLVPRDILTLK